LPADTILTSTNFGTVWQRSPPNHVDELCVENGTSTVNSPLDSKAVLSTFPFAVSTTTVASAPVAVEGRLSTFPWTVTLPVGHLAATAVLKAKVEASNNSNFLGFLIVSP
jgi:hypothetical protein